MMKRWIRELVFFQLVPLFALGTVWAAGANAGKTYAAKCASCHGKDGKGNPAMGKVLKVDVAALNVIDEPTLAKTDVELAKITTDGSGKMPAYKGKLTGAEITELVAYIRSLKK